MPASLDDCRALLDYDGPAREVVARVKYRNHRSSLGWLAAGMAQLLLPDEVDVVTWAPTTPERRRARGFDHAEVLARRVARAHRLACRGLLVRAPGTAQTGSTSSERRRGPRFRSTRRIDGLRIVLVDDVITTGTTLDVAGRALRDAGAVEIVGLTAAHTR